MSLIVNFIVFAIEVNFAGQINFSADGGEVGTFVVSTVRNKKNIEGVACLHNERHVTCFTGFSYFCLSTLGVGILVLSFDCTLPRNSHAKLQEVASREEHHLPILKELKCLLSGSGQSGHERTFNTQGLLLLCI